MDNEVIAAFEMWKVVRVVPDTRLGSNDANKYTYRLSNGLDVELFAGDLLIVTEDGKVGFRCKHPRLGHDMIVPKTHVAIPPVVTGFEPNKEATIRVDTPLTDRRWTNDATNHATLVAQPSQTVKILGPAYRYRQEGEWIKIWFPAVMGKNGVEIRRINLLPNGQYYQFGDQAMVEDVDYPDRSYAGRVYPKGTLVEVVADYGDQVHCKRQEEIVPVMKHFILPKSSLHPCRKPYAPDSLVTLRKPMCFDGTGEVLPAGHIAPIVADRGDVVTIRVAGLTHAPIVYKGDIKTTLPETCNDMSYTKGDWVKVLPPKDGIVHSWTIGNGVKVELKEGDRIQIESYDAATGCIEFVTNPPTRDRFRFHRNFIEKCEPAIVPSTKEPETPLLYPVGSLAVVTLPGGKSLCWRSPNNQEMILDAGKVVTVEYDGIDHIIFAATGFPGGCAISKNVISPANTREGIVSVWMPTVMIEEVKLAARQRLGTSASEFVLRAVTAYLDTTNPTNEMVESLTKSYEALARKKLEVHDSTAAFIAATLIKRLRGEGFLPDKPTVMTTGTPAPKLPKPRPEYEYKVIPIHQSQALNNGLDEMGKAGWMMTGSDPRCQVGVGSLVFMREKRKERLEDLLYLAMTPVAWQGNPESTKRAVRESQVTRAVILKNWKKVVRRMSGDQIKQMMSMIRQDLALSEGTISAHAGCSTDTWTDFEAGRMQPNNDLIAKLHHFYTEQLVLPS